MSVRIGDLAIIAPEPKMMCFLCGKVEETRPYGPNGEEICFTCGLKNEAETVAQMNMRLFGQSREEAERNAANPSRPKMADVRAATMKPN